MTAYAFDEQGAKRIVRAVKRVEGTPIDLVGRRLPPTPTAAPGATACIISAVENLYLVVQRVDSAGESSGTEFNVARPFKCRADSTAAYHPEATTITVASPNRVTASASGEDDETWEVRPTRYDIGDIIVAVRVNFTGVAVEGVPVSWIDSNVDARAWALVDSDTEVEA